MCRYMLFNSDILINYWNLVLLNRSTHFLEGLQKLLIWIHCILYMLNIDYGSKFNKLRLQKRRNEDLFYSVYVVGCCFRSFWSNGINLDGRVIIWHKWHKSIHPSCLSSSVLVVVGGVMVWKIFSQLTVSSNWALFKCHRLPECCCQPFPFLYFTISDVSVRLTVFQSLRISSER